MKIKIIRKHDGIAVYGQEYLPSRYRVPLINILNTWAYLLTRFQPASLGQLATMIREHSVDGRAQLDADLLDDFEAAAQYNMKPPAGLKRLAALPVRAA